MENSSYFSILLDLGAFPQDILGKEVSDYECVLMSSMKGNLPWAEVSLVFGKFDSLQFFFDILVKFSLSLGKKHKKFALFTILST
jgi:hypothetical protein